VAPGIVWEELNTFNEDIYEGKLTLEAVPEKRCIMITQADEEDPSNNLSVKVKFFNATGEEIVEEPDMRPKLRL